MLKWIVRKRLIRFYDVISVIILSAAVNILIWGWTVNVKVTFLFYLLLMLGFIALVGGGWSFCWLYQEVDHFLKDTFDDEVTAIIRIREKGNALQFQLHFVLGVLLTIGGVVMFVISNRV